MWSESSFSGFVNKLFCPNCKKTLTRSCSLQGTQTQYKLYKAPSCLKVTFPLANRSAAVKCCSSASSEIRGRNNRVFWVHVSRETLFFQDKCVAGFSLLPISSYSNLYSAKPHSPLKWGFSWQRNTGMLGEVAQGLLCSLHSFKLVWTAIALCRNRPCRDSRDWRMW